MHTSAASTVHRGPLEPAVAAAVRSLASVAAAADGVPPLSEQPLLALTADAPTVHLEAREPGGELTGYAQLDLGAPGAATAELVVAPQWRRRGVGGALLAQARALAAADRSGNSAAEATGRRFSIWAHGDLPAARALAERAGLAVVRELWLMGADLTRPVEADPPALAPGVAVRAFVPGQDEQAWRRVNARAFVHHPEQGRMSRQDLDARIAEPWFDPGSFLLAERDGVLLGSIWMKVHPADGAEGPAGEIYVLGVDPDAQGLGLGGALTRLGLDHLIGRGLSRAILYTEGDNAVAIRAYARAGFTHTSSDVQFGSRRPTPDDHSR